MRAVFRRSSPSLIALLLTLVSCDDERADPLRLNHLQALGSHNSYHQLAGAPVDPELDYVHAPLAEQLDAGVRHVEIDVHRDADSGVLAVYHIKHLDEVSSCETLAACLGELRAWSDRHPRHHLIIVLLEPKDDLARAAIAVGADPAATGELPWTGAIAAIDDEIRRAWPDRLLVPRQVIGDHASLRAAITADGWPAIDQTRQHLAVVLLDTGAVRDEYRQLPDPACFVFAGLDDPDAAFIKADDPVGDAELIDDALSAGLIVRTRADAATEVEAGRTREALGSGAQLVSTDYPIARDDGAHPGYRIPWPNAPDHPSRCNPVTAPPSCRDEDIE